MKEAGKTMMDENKRRPPEGGLMRTACYSESPNLPSSLPILRSRGPGYGRNYVMTVPNHDTVRRCKHCRSRRICRDGVRHNKSGDVQLLRCLDCQRRFSANIGFRYRQHPREVITECLRLHFSGVSVRRIVENLAAKGITAGHATIHRWIERYGPVAAAYMDSLNPAVGSKFRADELYVNAGGEKKYLFASMDDDTRYWLAMDLADRKEGHDATRLFADTLEQADKIPDTMVTDGLNSYRKAAKSVMPLTEHIREIHITGMKKGRDNNNRMERLNGTIRDREKTFRGLQGTHTREFCGLRVNYNHARRHQALKRTPGEEAGIMVEGPDKWKTMIQNGSLFLTQTGGRV